MVNLTPRLKKVADYVRKGVVLADIGTDHAYIPVYLILNGKISRAYACDINEGPLDNAKRIIEEGDIDGVTLLISDGFEALPEDCAEDFVIAGMGGELISDILSRCSWIKNKKYNLILQPMTRAEVLREYLYSNGFAIDDECFAQEKDKLYSVIKAHFTGKAESISPAQALLGKAYNDGLFIFKAQREVDRLNKKLEGLRKAGLADEINNTEELINEIKGIIDDYC